MAIVHHSYCNSLLFTIKNNRSKNNMLSLCSNKWCQVAARSHTGNIITQMTIDQGFCICHIIIGQSPSCLEDHYMSPTSRWLRQLLYIIGLTLKHITPVKTENAWWALMLWMNLPIAHLQSADSIHINLQVAYRQKVTQNILTVLQNTLHYLRLSH